MRNLLMASVVMVATGCSAFVPADTAFNTTLDRAHAVDCDVKSLEWTRQRTRLECFHSPRQDTIPCRSNGQRGSEV